MKYSCPLLFYVADKIKASFFSWPLSSVGLVAIFRWQLPYMLRFGEIYKHRKLAAG